MTEDSEKSTDSRQAAIGSEHAQRMLDTVLEHPAPRRTFKQTMIFDMVLGIGLLIAVGASPPGS